MWPNWDAYEHRIRSLAGLGRVDPAGRATSAAHRHAEVDVCVVGAGPSGLAAALAALEQGKRVLLIEERAELGGSLLHREAAIDGLQGAAWAGHAERKLQDGRALILRRSTALGLYDHNVLAVVQKEVPSSANGERIWLVRSGQIIVAAGAIERPLLFANNDRPGVMLADAVLVYLRRYALRLGERVVVATTNDSTYEAALALRQAGSAVHLIDARAEADLDPALVASMRAAGVALLPAATIDSVIGKSSVEAVALSNGDVIVANLVAQSGGWTPSLHLYCHAKGKPIWDASVGSYRPGGKIAGIDVVGAAAGIWDLDVHASRGDRNCRGTAGWRAALQHQGQAMDGADRGAIRCGQARQADLGRPAERRDHRRHRIGGAGEFLSGRAPEALYDDRDGDRPGQDIQRQWLWPFSRPARPATLRRWARRPSVRPIVPVSMATVAGAERGQFQAPIRRLPAENTASSGGRPSPRLRRRPAPGLVRRARHGDRPGMRCRPQSRCRLRCVVAGQDRGDRPAGGGAAGFRLLHADVEPCGSGARATA